MVGWWGLNPGSHAFVYSNGTVTGLPDLNSYNGGNSIAAGINDNGQIVVNANDTATSQTRTLLLTPS